MKNKATTVLPEDLQIVILIGAGRSGTKFLRDTLGASKDVAIVPYDIGYVWRYGNEGFPDDAIPQENVNRKIKTYIKKTVCKLSNIKKEPEKTIIVEKTVGNTLRIPFVNKIFPGAKFIHLVRDGREVTESSMRMWEAPPEAGYLLKKLRYFPIHNYKYAFWYLANIIKGKFSKKIGINIWGPRYPGISKDIDDNCSLEEICAKQWKYCVGHAFEGLKEIPDENKIEVRYERLIDEISEIDRICDFMGIKDKQAVVEYHTKNLRKDTKRKWDKLANLKLIKIEKIICNLQEQLGYK